MDLLSGQPFGQGSGSGRRALRVVGAVQNKDRVVAEHFKSCRPDDRFQPFAYGIFRNVQPGFAEHPHRFQDQGGVLQLVIAEEAQAVDAAVPQKGLS